MQRLPIAQALLVGALTVAERTSVGATDDSMPFFANLVNAHENSSLSMECEGDPLAAISCHFTQVLVSVDSNADAAPKMTPKDRLEFRRDLCERRKPMLPKQPPERAALTERILERLNRACACPDDKCLDEAVTEFFGRERRCKVWTHTFSATLKRVSGQSKWIGTQESGVCRDVNATVIESDGKGILSRWRFTQTRLTTDATLDVCKGRTVNEPAIYSWEADRGAALLNCEVIEFGH